MIHDPLFTFLQYIIKTPPEEQKRPIKGVFGGDAHAQNNIYSNSLRITSRFNTKLRVFLEPSL